MARRKFSRLKSLMYERELTQSDLTEVVGRGKTYISRRLNGKEPFNTEDIKIISDMLNIPLSECTEYFFEP